MGALRSLTKGASTLRPVITAVRGVEKAAQASLTLSVADGEPHATARLRALIGPGISRGSAGAGPLIAVVVAGHPTAALAQALAAAKRDGRRAIAFVVGEADVRARLERELLDHRPLELSNVAHLVSLDDAEHVRLTLARLLGSDAVAVANGCTGLRDAIADALIAQACRQAGSVGAAAVVPGADLPVLTLMQVRLVAQLAAVYGRPLDARRGLEIAGVIASAFGWRALARRVVASVPVAGFALRAGVAFSATRAVGEAGKSYFATLGDRADAPLDGLAKALNGALEKRKRDPNENANPGIG